jgi:hypothetical protein
MVPPDIFRLRYRQALGQVVVAIVRGDKAATASAARAQLAGLIPKADQAHFIRLVQEEFTALHPGNAVGFGLRPLELAAWRKRHVKGG